MKLIYDFILKKGRGCLNLNELWCKSKILLNTKNKKSATCFEKKQMNIGALHMRGLGTANST